MNERGAILVQFGLLTVGLYGIAALTIDMGFVIHAQETMQVAADGAALEGLRFRDAASDEVERRLRVRSLVQWQFDDDFDPTDGDTRQFGAGPLLVLDGGLPDSNALATLSFDPAAPVWDPLLELNLADAPHGDMVAGVFDIHEVPG